MTDTEVTTSYLEKLDAILSRQSGVTGTSTLLSGVYAMPPPDKHKPLFPTPGVPREVFILIVKAACIIHNLSDGDKSSFLDPDVIKRHLHSSEITTSQVKRVTQSPNFHQALILRGVLPAQDAALSGEQLRALSILTDVSSHKPLERRLKEAGIEKYKWDAWMNNSIFRAAHDKLAHDIFQKAQSTVDLQVTSGALSGKLEFIKYFNEITGKHSPSRRAHADVQMILNDVVAIITRNVTDQETLKQISAELSVAISKLG